LHRVFFFFIKQCNSFATGPDKIELYEIVLKTMDYSDLWSKSYPAKVYLLFSLGFLLQLNRMYITLSINNNSDPQHLPYSPPFSWMKSATSKSSATPMATWLTAAVKLILKEMSASCHLKLTIQTSFSHTKDQLTM